MAYALTRRVTKGQAEFSRLHHGCASLTEWRQAIERLPFTGPVAGRIVADRIVGDRVELTITRTATSSTEVSRAFNALERFIYPGTP